MNVLVTGGAGYIGSHIVVELLKAGYGVIVEDDLSNSSREALLRAEELGGGRVIFYENDVRDRAATELIFAAHDIGWVIHLAGLKCVPESVKDPLLYYDHNLQATVVLLQTMQKYGVKRLVFSSSATVYGMPERLPLDENCKTGGTTSPYGETKLMQERILRDVHAADGEWTIAVLRYFNPVGAHESGRIGEDPKGVPNNLMPYVAQVASGRLDHIRVCGNDYPTPDGTGVRDYIHVTDLALGHLAAIERLTRAGVYTYNLGTGRGYSVLELVHAFSRACGRELPYEIVPRREGDIAEYYASSAKAERGLGWRAERDLEKMCRDQWNWQKNNPNGYEK